MKPIGAPVRSLAVFFLAATLCSPLVAQIASPDAMMKDIQEALDAENYDGALGLLQRAKKAFPTDPEFPTLLGDIYSEKDFSTLALEEYRIAERLHPNEPNVLYKLSQALGKLNREKESIYYLERVHAVRPEDSGATGDLGWMYFKVHQLAKGERLLVDALNAYGPNSNYNMTLGTIYSETYEYDKARAHYLAAIKSGIKAGSDSFVAVAYYNLSLLEEKFHNFSKAMEYGDRSVKQNERPSGHLAKGELFLRKQDIRSAYNEFKTAYNLDTSPLSEINLANTQRCAGKIEESIRYLDGVIKSKNLSWMLNYGTDLKTHLRDLHDIYKDDYAALAILERSRASGSVLEATRRFFRALGDDILAYYHRQMYRTYSMEIAKAFMDEGNTLNAMIAYYNAYEGYPEIAQKYLTKAREFETTVVPQTAASYNLEEGLLFNDYGKLEAAYEAFDPVWENDGIAKALQRLCLLARARNDEAAYNLFAERLYGVNPGALLQGGIGLPVNLVVHASPSNAPTAAVLLRRELSTMFQHAHSPIAEGRAPKRYTIDVVLDQKNFTWALIDGETGRTVIRQKTRLPSLDRRETAALFNGMLDAIYNSD